MDMETDIYELLNAAGLWQDWFIYKWKIILKLLMIQPPPSLPPPTPSHTRSTYQHLPQYLVGFIHKIYLYCIFQMFHRITACDRGSARCWIPISSRNCLLLVFSNVSSSFAIKRL